MMDFTHLPTRRKAYGGANGNKLSIVFKDELWMLKLPSPAQRNMNLSYSNSSFSEYLGCHIFDMLGVPAQETMLGSYTYHGVTRSVVACKDFTTPNTVVMDFASVKNQIIDSTSNGYGTELNDILETIQKQTVIDPKVLSDRFWDMFVIDALIGNWDRHNGNWGFLYNQMTDEVSLAPVYDCGSALFPQIDESLAKKIMASKRELLARVYDYPTSSINLNGRRINYHKFISEHKYEECDRALLRIVPRINIAKVFSLVDETEIGSGVVKEFLKRIIKMRKELILDAPPHALEGRRTTAVCPSTS